MRAFIPALYGNAAVPRAAFAGSYLKAVLKESPVPLKFESSITNGITPFF
jgi:hypothetical protein